MTMMKTSTIMKTFVKTNADHDDLIDHGIEHKEAAAASRNFVLGPVTVFSGPACAAGPVSFFLLYVSQSVLTCTIYFNHMTV